MSSKSLGSRIIRPKLPSSLQILDLRRLIGRSAGYLSRMRSKDDVRREVWKAMEREGVSRFPGAEGRIPNFAGAKLDSASFFGSDLRRCNLSGASMRRADMRGRSAS